MGEQETIRFDGEGNLLRVLKDLVSGWNSLQKAEEQASRVVASTSNKLKQQRLTIEQNIDAGRKLTATFKQTAKGMELVSSRLTDTTRQLREKAQAERAARIESQKAIAAAKQQAQIALRGVRGGFTNANIQQAGGTDTELFNVRNAESNLLELVQRHKISAGQVLGLWRNVQQGRLVAATGVTRQLQAALVRLKQSHERVGRVASQVEAKRFRDLKSSAEALRRARTQQEGVNQTIQKGGAATQTLAARWSFFAKLVVSQAVHAALSRVVSALSEAVGHAKDLSIAIAEIQTIDRTNTSISELEEQLIRVSNAFGADVLDVAEGQYETISNQIVKTAKDFRFLEEASKFAIASVSSTEDAVNLLSSALNSFKLSTSETDRVASVFFKTIDLGRVRADELADIFGRVGIPANQLGVTLEEVTAALATLTIQGVKADEAITFLRNVFQKLNKPTEAMKQVFKDLRVETGQELIAIEGLGGALQLLENRTRGSSKEIAALFGRIRAITGATGLLGDNLDLFKKNVDEMKNSSKQYGKAIDTVLDSSGKQFENIFNEIKNFFVRDFGGAIVEAVVFVDKNIVSLRGSVEVLTTALISLGTAGIATVVAWLGRLVVANPAILALTAITAAIVSITRTIRDNGEAAELAFGAQRELLKDLELQTQEKLASIRSEYDEVSNSLIEIFREPRKQIVVERGQIDSELESLGESFKKTQATIEDVFAGIEKSMSKSLREAEKALDQTKKALEDLQEFTTEFSKTIQEALLQEKLGSASPQEQLRLLTQEFQKLRKEAVALAQTTDQQALEENFKRRLELIKEIRDVEKNATEQNKRASEERERLQQRLMAAQQKFSEISRKAAQKEETLRRKRQNALNNPAGKAFTKSARAGSIERQITVIQQNAEQAKRNQLASISQIQNQLQSVTTVQLQRVDTEASLVALQKEQVTLADRQRKILEATQKRQEEERNRRQQQLLDTKKAFRDLLDFNVDLSKLATQAKTEGLNERELEQRLSGALQGKLTNFDALSQNLQNLLQSSGVDLGAFVQISTQLAERRQQIEQQADLQIQRFGLDARLQTIEQTQNAELANVEKLKAARLEAERELAAERQRALVELQKAVNNTYKEVAGVQLPLRFGETPFGPNEVTRRVSSVDTDGQVTTNIKRIIESGSIQQLDNVINRVNIALRETTRISHESGFQGKAAQRASTSFTEALQALIETRKKLRKINDTSKEIELLNARLRQFRQELSLQARGRAAGGTVGATDSVGTALTPGETVIDRRNSRRFANQIRAINSGSPSVRNTTNSFGNVTIGITSTGNKEQDIIQLGKALKRQISRGALPGLN